ncbi:MAG: DNA polymerase III subunit beta, partial [Actinomycetota bacterium]
MRITCSRTLLLENLQSVLKTVSTKSTMPVLSGIRLEIKAGQKVELASTDMELSLRLTMEVKVEGEGALVAPGRLMTDVVRSLHAGEVTLEMDEKEQVLEVSCGTASFHL